MALLTSTTLIRTLALFHLSLSYLFLTSPHTIADQNLVFILGEAMGLVRPLPLPITNPFVFPRTSSLTSPKLISPWCEQPHAPSFRHPTASTALLSAVLALSALSDLTAVALPAEHASHYWGAQAPVRLLFYFAVLGYTYLFKPGGVFAAATAGKGWGEELKNSVVFTWAFVEMMCWFWVYITLRDERREAAVRVMERRKAEEDML